MNKWKETLSILLISVSFIALVLFIQPNETKESEFKTRIPKSTTEHYLFNASSLIKKLVFDELFVHEDEVLVQKVKELVSKDSKTETSLSDLNIDYTAPLEVISFKINQKSFTALKFKISNADKFDQNQLKLRKALLFRNKLNAYWVLGELKSSKTLFQKYIINNSFEYLLKNDESKQFVSKFSNSKLVSFGCIQAKDHLLKIEQKNFRNQTHTSLKPKGFHLSTEINSSQFGSLQENRISELIHLKELNYISLNYLCLNFIDDSEIQAIPKFEVLLCYKNKISGNSITSNVLKHVDLPFKIISKERFQLGQQSINIKQIDTNQFIISTLNNFQLTKTFLNPFVTGDPKNIVKISNAGWKGLFLELIPAFKTSKNLLESTNKISTYQNKQGYHIICLSFKKNEDALHSLLKFALNLQ
ncbi:MAG: hypothetical protein ACOVQG_10160 [Crocinitomicaceae bacterium]